MANGRGVRPTVCKRCGALALDGARISFRALCSDCAARAVAENNAQLNAGEGEAYDVWRARMREYLTDTFGVDA